MKVGSFRLTIRNVNDITNDMDDLANSGFRLTIRNVN